MRRLVVWCLFVGLLLQSSLDRVHPTPALATTGTIHDSAEGRHGYNIAVPKPLAVVKTVALGDSTGDLVAADASAHRAIVVGGRFLSSARTLTVINTQTARVLTDFILPEDANASFTPNALVVDTRRHRAYVLISVPPSLMAVNVQTGRTLFTQSLPPDFRSPAAVAVNPSTGQIYVTAVKLHPTQGLSAAAVLVYSEGGKLIRSHLVSAPVDILDDDTVIVDSSRHLLILGATPGETSHQVHVHVAEIQVLDLRSLDLRWQQQSPYALGGLAYDTKTGMLWELAIGGLLTLVNGTDGRTVGTLGLSTQVPPSWSENLGVLVDGKTNRGYVTWDDAPLQQYGTGIDVLDGVLKRRTTLVSQSGMTTSDSPTLTAWVGMNVAQHQLYAMNRLDQTVAFDALTGRDLGVFINGFSLSNGLDLGLAFDAAGRHSLIVIATALNQHDPVTGNSTEGGVIIASL